MGTRSLTYIKEKGPEGPAICCIYQQYDGYPSGVGKIIHDILKGTAVVNGFSDKAQKQHNGMGCLAATLIAKRKKGIGNVYVYPADSKDCGEDYTYTIYLSDRMVIQLKCEGNRGVIYDGPLDDFDPEMES